MNDAMKKAANGVAPLVGARIEIPAVSVCNGGVDVAPLVGARIEILKVIL